MKTIEVLTCYPDGKQIIEQVEVPDDYFDDKRSSSELRETAYNSDPIIEWDGSMITVTQASQLWQYYAAEGSSKANQLQTLISEAKATIRAKYPD